MPNLFDSRFIDEDAIYAHRFDHVGTVRYGSSLSPSLQHNLSIVSSRSDTPPAVGVIISVDKLGAYVVMEGTPDPLEAEVGATVSWTYAPGAVPIAKVAYDIVGSANPRQIDSRALGPADLYIHPFVVSGTFTFVGYRADKGGGYIEGVRGRLLVNAANPSVPVTEIVLADEMEPTAKDVLVAPDDSIIWVVNSGTWYVTCSM